MTNNNIQTNGTVQAGIFGNGDTPIYNGAYGMPEQNTGQPIPTTFTDIAGQPVTIATGSPAEVKFKVRQDMTHPRAPMVAKVLLDSLPKDDPCRGIAETTSKLIDAIQKETLAGISPNDALPQPVSPQTLAETWMFYRSLQDQMTQYEKQVKLMSFTKIIMNMLKTNEGAMFMQDLVNKGMLNDQDSRIVMEMMTDLNMPVNVLGIMQACLQELAAWLFRCMAVEYNVTMSPDTLVGLLMDGIRNSNSKQETEQKQLDALANFGIISHNQIGQFSQNYVMTELTLAERIKQLAALDRMMWTNEDYLIVNFVDTYINTGMLPADAPRINYQQYIESIKNQQQQQPVQQPVQQQPVNGPVQTRTPISKDGLPVQPQQVNQNNQFNNGGNQMNNFNNNLGGNNMYNNQFNGGQVQGGYVVQPQQQFVQQPQQVVNQGYYSNPVFAQTPAQPMVQQQQFAPVQQPVVQGYGQPQQAFVNNGQATYGYFNQQQPVNQGYGYNAAPVQQPVVNQGFVQQPVQQVQGYGAQPVQQPVAQGYGQPVNFNNGYSAAPPQQQLPQGLGSPSQLDKSVTDQAILNYQVSDYGRMDDATGTKILMLVEPQTGRTELVTQMYYNLRRQCLANPAYAQQLLAQQQRKNGPVYGQPQIVELPDNYGQTQVYNQQPQQQVYGYAQQPVQQVQGYGYSQPVVNQGFVQQPMQQQFVQGYGQPQVFNNGYNNNGYNLQAPDVMNQPMMGQQNMGFQQQTPAPIMPGYM